MAFKAIQQNGKWYVSKGQKFWPDTESETFEGADEEATRREMRDLYIRCERMYDKGVAKGYFEADCFTDYLA